MLELEPCYDLTASRLSPSAVQEVDKAVALRQSAARVAVERRRADTRIRPAKR